MAFLLSLLSTAILANGLALPQGQPQGPGGFGGGAQAQTSPAYPLYQFPLPIPATAQPITTQTVNGKTIQFYEMTLEAFNHNVYSSLGSAKMLGYNGTSPGPTFRVDKGVETVVRLVNMGTGPAAMHLHGSPTHSPWDGWASDLLQVGQFKDYYYPNAQAGPLWYHDHVDGKSSGDVYYGQTGVYIIHDPAEDSLGLPSGNYDIPLAISDKTYQSNGDLASPAGSNVNFFGDVIHVNEQPWPYLAVEPRKYRFRFYDVSLSRPYDLQFTDSKNNAITVQAIATDGGLFGSPVSTRDIAIGMGERYEVVIDFAAYQGTNVTLLNKLSIGGVTAFTNTDKVMRFVVGNTTTSTSNNGAVPSTLRTVPFPAKKTTVDHTFNFQHGGDAFWTINGESFDDINNRVLAKPQQGLVELWQLNYAAGPGVHPIHVHLVNFQVVSRTGGRGAVTPYEAAGLKDVVLLEPGERVQVLAFYGPWNGMYMFHCHNLVHEDSLMMGVFNVTLLSALGYSPLNDTQGFQDPLDSRFAPQTYQTSVDQPSAVSSTLSNLGGLDAYVPMTAVVAAEKAYYATATPTST